MRAPGAPAESVLRQLDRVVNSTHLRGSESLCRLLRYLSEQSLQFPGAPIKEYQIATEVFGRSADFDPRLDATVRVQTGRLRSKLAEYYGGEGARDPVILEIPKGAYLVVARVKPDAEPQTRAGSELPRAGGAAPSLDPVPSAVSRPAFKWTPWLICAGLAAALFYAILARPLAKSAPPPAEVRLTAVQTFWRPFAEGPEPPLVVFSNAEFVGRPETGMRYFNPATDTRNAILDHYTGVGEVLGIHELDRTFGVLRQGLRVKRGRLLTLDDAKTSDLIFVGSPSENLALRDIRPNREFVFQVAAEGARAGDLEIVNLNPLPGEQKEYIGPKTLPLDADYAFIGVVPGLNPARSVMLLAGTTTIGTQAAVEYVCREQSLRELLSRVGPSGPNDLRLFEAVIKVAVTRGVPVNSQLMALHPRQ